MSPKLPDWVPGGVVGRIGAADLRPVGGGHGAMAAPDPSAQPQEGYDGHDGCRDHTPAGLRMPQQRTVDEDNDQRLGAPERRQAAQTNRLDTVSSEVSVYCRQDQSDYQRFGAAVPNVAEPVGLGIGDQQQADRRQHPSGPSTKPAPYPVGEHQGQQPTRPYEQQLEHRCGIAGLGDRRRKYDGQRLPYRAGGRVQCEPTHVASPHQPAPFVPGQRVRQQQR